MRAVGARVQVLDAPHRAEIELAIEMWEQLVIARTLPAQRRPQRIDIDLDQEQAGLAGEEFSRGFRDLGCSREMDVAVPRVIGAAAVDALPFGLAPGRSGADFVDGGPSFLRFNGRVAGNARPYRRP
jgi:hypothetical protein